LMPTECIHAEERRESGQRRRIGEVEGKERGTPACVFHFSPAWIVAHAAYQAWVGRLKGIGVRHVWLGHTAVDPQEPPHPFYSHCYHIWTYNPRFYSPVDPQEPPHPSQAAAAVRLHAVSAASFPLPVRVARDESRLGGVHESMLWSRRLTAVALLGAGVV